VTYCDVESIKRRKVLGHAIVDVHYFGQHIATRTVPRQGSLARPNPVVRMRPTSTTPKPRTQQTPRLSCNPTCKSNMQHKDDRH
jgi:hypothetical protein